jgi:ABC-type glutathione transport system ATPase component
MQGNHPGADGCPEPSAEGWREEDVGTWAVAGTAKRASRAARMSSSGRRPAPPGVSGALADGEAEIELRGVSQRFRTRHRETLALTGIDLGIRKQEFVTLVGQSGCGKTTMLRVSRA